MFGILCLLGAAYASGKGVAKDWVEAYKWAHISAENGDLSGSDLRYRPRRTLKKKQIEEGEKRATKFRAKTEGGDGN